MPCFARQCLPCFATQCLPQTNHCPEPAASVPTLNLHSKHQSSHKLGLTLLFSLLELESCTATAKLPPIPPHAAMVKKRKLADAGKREDAGLATTTSHQAPKAQAPRLMTTKHKPKPNSTHTTTPTSHQGSKHPQTTNTKPIINQQEMQSWHCSCICRS